MASNLPFFCENELTTVCHEYTAKFGRLATIFFGGGALPRPQRGITNHANTPSYRPCQRGKHNAISRDRPFPLYFSEPHLINWPLTLTCLTFCTLVLVFHPPPGHSFIPALKPSFYANPSHRSLLFFFRIDSTNSPDCLPILLSTSVFFLLFSFSLFHF